MVHADGADERDAERIAAALRAAGFAAVTRPSGARLAAWLADAEPVRFGERLTVCAAWSMHDRDTLPGLVEIGPGGFGNGHHPTTRLLIEQLLGRLAGGERLLDVGCGSGVLGLGALRLGAARVVAVDVKDEAVDATRRNARLERHVVAVDGDDGTARRDRRAVRRGVGEHRPRRARRVGAVARPAGGARRLAGGQRDLAGAVSTGRRLPAAADGARARTATGSGPHWCSDTRPDPPIASRVCSIAYDPRMVSSTPARARPRRRTVTSNFGVGSRESHDASAFYERFQPPELSTDDTVADPPARRRAVRLRRRPAHGRGAPTARSRSSSRRRRTSPASSTRRSSSARACPSSYLEYLELLRDVFAECARMLEPGGRIAVNVANLGRKPYRSLSADVIRILAGRPRPAAARRDHLAEGRGRERLVRVGLVPQRGEPGAARRHRAGGRRQQGPLRPGPPAERARRRRAAAPRARSATDDFMALTLDVWSIPPESARRVGHPAPFPVELPEQLIRLYTYADDLVLDPFMGSGSALVAAARLGRRYVGYDLDPAYVDVARRRVTAEGSADGGAARTTHRPPDRLAERQLTAAGFTIVHRAHRVRGTGVSVSFVATDAAGETWWFDVCGAHTSHRGGMLRADVVWRSLGRAAALRHRRHGSPLVLLTSHAPRRPGEGDAALRAAGPDTCFDVVELSAEADLERLAVVRRGRSPGAATRRLLDRSRARLTAGVRGCRLRRSPPVPRRCCRRSASRSSVSNSPYSASRSCSRSRSSTNARWTPVPFSSDVEAFEQLGGGDVDIGDGLALQDDPARLVLADVAAHLLAEQAGVGEEQRRLPPEDDHAVRRRARPRRPARRLCQPSRSNRPSSSPWGHQLRWKNSRIDSAMATTMPSSTPRKMTPAVATSESTSDDGRTRQKWRSASKSASDIAAAMTTAASVGCGRSASRLGQEHEQDRDDPGADQPGELRLGAGLVGDGGPRAAGRHGEALEEAGGDVRRADADHLLVGVRPRRRGAPRSSTTWRSCRSTRRA